MNLGIGICYYNEKLDIENIFTQEEIELHNDLRILCEIASIKRAIVDAFHYEFSFKNIFIQSDENGRYCARCALFPENDTVIKLSREKEFVISCVSFNVDERYKYFNISLSKAEVNDNNVMSTKMIKELVPKRKNKSHKGTYGKCFVIAGSTGLTGAAYLASQSCVKCGSGLVSLGCAKSLNPIFEVMLKEVMTIPLADKSGILIEESIIDILKKSTEIDVLLLGCGISVNEDTIKICSSIVDNVSLPIIIDADGINCIAKNIDILKGHKQPIVITPHFMEFSRISGKSIYEIESNPTKAALEFASEYNVVVVLKSENTVVATPDGRYFTNPLGNPGMATGGTGDVLAGAITSFVGQGLSIQDASVLGVFIHSLAGDMSALDKGLYGMTPSDILENIPYALKYLGG